jgi:AAA15 family ATPase/GTPase
LINSVSIYGFKIFEKLENLPLKKITLISGKNNTGKTTILEALCLYLYFNTPDIFEKLFILREFSGTWEHNELWGKLFYDRDSTEKIRISASSNKAENGQLSIKFVGNYETAVPFPITENGMTTLRKNFPALEIKHSSNGSTDYQAHILYHGSISNYLKEIDSLKDQPSLIYLTDRMRLYEKNTEYLGILDKDGEQDKILPLLKLLEPNLVRLQLINDGGNNIIYADFGNRKKIPVNMLGDGFCRCLTMALILATRNANLFFIDEVGAGIHYSVQENLWDFLAGAAELYDCQIVATTHSHDTIKAFNSIIKRNNASNFSYIRLGKGKEGIKPYIFEPDTLEYSLSSKLEVR